MLTRLTAHAAARAASLALPIGLAVALGAAPPASAQYQYQCQPGHYEVVVPGYVSLPAAVDVRCAGSITTVDIQWPFDDPSPEAWHNQYELNTADMTCSITVGGQWLCTLQWIPTDGGRTRYVIDGCPEIYGGTGAPVPWDDACIQKVRNRVYPDFWIFKNLILQNGSTGVRAMNRMLGGISESGGATGGQGDGPTLPAGPSSTPMTPGVDEPFGPSGTLPQAPKPDAFEQTPKTAVPAPHPFEIPESDFTKETERRPPV